MVTKKCMQIEVTIPARNVMGARSPKLDPSWGETIGSKIPKEKVFRCHIVWLHAIWCQQREAAERAQVLRTASPPARPTNLCLEVLEKRLSVLGLRPSPSLPPTASPTVSPCCQVQLGSKKQKNNELKIKIKKKKVKMTKWMKILPSEFYVCSNHSVNLHLFNSVIRFSKSLLNVRDSQDKRICGNGKGRLWLLETTRTLFSPTRRLKSGLAH